MIRPVFAAGITYFRQLIPATRERASHHLLAEKHVPAEPHAFEELARIHDALIARDRGEPFVFQDLPDRTFAIGREKKSGPAGP